MHRRLRIALIATLVAIAAVGTALIALNGGDSESESIASDTTTTTESTTSTTVTSPPSTTSTTSVTTTTEGLRTTTTEPYVGDQCGASAEPNHLQVTVCVDGPVLEGERARLRIEASDDNARVRNDCGSPIVDWGDDEETAVCAIGCEPSPLPTGPSSIDITRDHVYDRPGRYEITVTVESNCGEAPTGERLTVDVRLDVTNAN